LVVPIPILLLNFLLLPLLLRLLLWYKAPIPSIPILFTTTILTT
jgi:hypothetical protein